MITIINKAMIFSSLLTSSVAMSTLECSQFDRASVIGAIPLLSNQNIVKQPSNSSENFYLHNAQLPHELLELIDSAEYSQSYQDHPETSSSVKYVASYDGSFCSPRSSAAFERWEEPFSSLQECCEAAFSWDLDTCLENELPEDLLELIASADDKNIRMASTNDIMYFPSYGEESCLPKAASEFESWEESFLSREDCCETVFSWNHACS